MNVSFWIFVVTISLIILLFYMVYLFVRNNKLSNGDKNSKRLLYILEESNTGYLIFDYDGIQQTEKFSPALTNLFHYSNFTNFSFKALLNCLSEDDSKNLDSMVIQLKKTGSPFSMSIYPESLTFPVSVVGKRVMNRSTIVADVLLFYPNQTSNSSANRVETRYEDLSLLGMLDNAFIELGKNFEINYYSPSLNKIFGEFTRKPLNLQEFFYEVKDLVPEANKFMNFVKKFEAGLINLTAPEKEEILLNNGRKLELIRVSFDKGYLIIFKDNTDLIESQNSLKLLEFRQDIIMNSLSDGLLFIAANGRITRFNKFLVKMFSPCDLSQGVLYEPLDSFFTQIATVLLNKENWDNIATGLTNEILARKEFNYELTLLDGSMVLLQSISLPNDEMLVIFAKIPSVSTNYVLNGGGEADKSLFNSDVNKYDFVQNYIRKNRDKLTLILGYSQMLNEGRFGELNKEQKVGVSQIKKSAGEIVVNLLAVVDDFPEKKLALEKVKITQVVEGVIANLKQKNILTNQKLTWHVEEEFEANINKEFIAELIEQLLSGSLMLGVDNFEIKYNVYQSTNELKIILYNIDEQLMSNVVVAIPNMDNNLAEQKVSFNYSSLENGIEITLSFNKV